jgi:hypothetical protein
MMNEETEQFERRLSRQPLRQIPHEWRREILAAARDTQTVCHPSPVTRRSLLSTLNHRLSTILWPHPKAWAGLAAVWILILAVNISLRDKSPQVAEKVSPASPEVIAELRQQKLLFAELIGSTETPVADRQKLFLPRPRSERAEVLTA